MNDDRRSELRAAIQLNNQELLNNLGQLIDGKMREMKRSADDVASRQLQEIKKMKFTEMPEFKRKANKDQFLHNRQVIQCFDDAKEKLVDNKNEELMQSLEEGMKLVQDRQKLVLLADKSPYGWLTVENYKSNALAEDEDDEKRLLRAENRAATEAKRRQNLRQSKSKFRNTGNSGQQAKNTAANAPVPAVSHQATYRKGSCFACGKFGHWKSECHLFNAAQASSSNNQ